MFVLQTTVPFQDKMLLETIARSVAMGAVLDQKQRWAAVMQVEPLRKVVAEALHQVSQETVKTALCRDSHGRKRMPRAGKIWELPDLVVRGVDGGQPSRAA